MLSLYLGNWIQLYIIPLSILEIISCATPVLFKTSLLCLSPESVLCIFFSSNFNVPGLTFRDLTHFESLCGQGERYELISIFFLHVDMQFSQHNLRAVFSFFSNKSTMGWVWNVSHRLIYLNTQSLVVALFWKVAESFGGRALLE